MMESPSPDGPDRNARDLLMPFHLELDAIGRIAHVGPSLARVRDPGKLVGKNLFEVFEIVRPAGLSSVDGVSDHTGAPLKLRLRNAPSMTLRGIAVPIGTGGILMNLSFGIAVVEAVRRFGLTNADFASTDLAIELLYLVEAKSAAFDEAKRLNVRLRDARNIAQHQADTDTLTGLANRRYLERVLEALIGAEAPFGLMHLDLDFFKDVNDTMGHAAGDAVLRVVASVLTEETRRNDTVARVGGDEFVLVLPDLVHGSDLGRIAGRVIERMEAPIDFQGQSCRVSASVGMTTSTIYQMPDAEQILHDADTALYESKRRGRGRSTLFSVDISEPADAPAVGDVAGLTGSDAGR